MEFPGLGQQCSFDECRQLDFLPVKCDLCKKIFCSEHYKYESHNCPTAYQKNVQVPICPLCNAPVPGRADELPDIRVGRHIDSDCSSDRAVTHRKKVYANRCTLKGCKQKEMIPVVCDRCGQNYCLKHRHPQDHTCPNINSKPMGPAALAAAARKSASDTSVHNGRSAAAASNGYVSSDRSRSVPVPKSRSANQASIQGNLSEDAALQLALQASMSEASGVRVSSSSGALSQEQSDFLLAKAIAESEQEALRNGPSSRGNQRKNCVLS
jgi:predicted nucleic acid binding AN1-type Zn finger protein